MANSVKKRIFIVDDELDVCKAISEALEESGYEVRYFTRAVDCLEQLNLQKCDLLITDLKMPMMDGIEFVKEIKRLAPWIPVLVVTGYGDVSTAVNAVKAGALDFIEKPLDKASFVSRISSILQRRTLIDSYSDEFWTQRELEILKLIIEGKANKEIASLLKLSLRTIELHRHYLMHKLKADNIADLVERVKQLGLLRDIG